MRLRLPEDHATAAVLKEIFSKYSELLVMKQEHPINMVFFRFAGRGETSGPGGRKETETRFLEACCEKGYLTYEPEGGWFRFVTHREVTEEDVESFGRDLPGILEAALG
jgi:threonine aldolase